MGRNVLYGLTTGLLLSALIGSGSAQAALMTFNSGIPANNATTRDSWLSAAGITTPQYLVDFETGFTEGQNVSGITGLFPGGLVIKDTTTSSSAKLRSSSTYFGGSNPVGSLSLAHNEGPHLVLDFTSRPVDYVAFQDIDHAGTNGVVIFTDGSSASISFETTGAGGDSAEFFGIFRNDMPQITQVKLDASGDGKWGIDTIEYGAPVPIPGAAWLFVSGLAGLVGLKRKKGQS